jgi:putative mRNA 3-end processing factor
MDAGSEAMSCAPSTSPTPRQQQQRSGIAHLPSPEVSCDGFHYGWPIRVQSHLHLDHMDAFETSKGNQVILASRETRELLIAKYDADLPYRNNLIGLDADTAYETETATVSLTPSGHMLGASQALVEVGGMRLVYSGDVQWPIDKVFTVDALVVDCTSGSPRKTRKYSQGFAEERLLELVNASLRTGPVEIQAFRGTLQRAMQVIAGNIDCPLVGSLGLEQELEVYRRFGYAIDPLHMSPPEDARYVRFVGTGDAKPVEHKGITIRVSAYLANGDDPVLTFSDRAYGVALCDHADFEGTLEYVEQTGAHVVVTDNSRGEGIELAQELRRRLGVDARPSSGKLGPGWGE